MARVAELIYFTGPMDCGKSTLALQVAYTESSAGRQGRLFTMLDRAGASTITSRIGLASPAEEVTADLDFWRYVVSELTGGRRVDFLVCDEAQFYTPAEHIDQLARIVDELQIDVFCFGILTDFRTELFPASRRLVELCDRMETAAGASPLLVRRAGHPQRPHRQRRDGHGGQPGGRGGHRLTAEVAYQVLCRRHHRRHVTAQVAAVTLSPEPLPFEPA